MLHQLREQVKGAIIEVFVHLLASAVVPDSEAPAAAQ
jgi:hypothetical protein